MKILIKGGWISGLTSAINLAKNDFDVEVHERKDFCGKIINIMKVLGMKDMKR